MRSGLAISLTGSLALIERFDCNDGQVEELGNELVIQKLAAYLILSIPPPVGDGLIYAHPKFNRKHTKNHLLSTILIIRSVN
jgi:hypothetical protein